MAELTVISLGGRGGEKEYAFVAMFPPFPDRLPANGIMKVNMSES
jgi:hypothetical protein